MTKKEQLREFRVVLPRDDVWKLREMAARASRDSNKPISWQELVRKAVAIVAEGGAK